MRRFWRTSVLTERIFVPALLADSVRVGDSPIDGLRLRCICRGHVGMIGKIAWSPCGRMIASPSSDRTVRIWDAQSGSEMMRLKGHVLRPMAVAWSPDSKQLVTAGDERLIRLWDVERGALRSTFKRVHGPTVSCVAWSPHRNIVATGSWDAKIAIWDPLSGEMIQTLDEHANHITCLAWSRDGAFLASGDYEGRVCIWDASTWRMKRHLRSGSGYAVYALDWDQEGQILFSGSEDCMLRRLAVANMQPSEMEGHVGPVISVASSCDGRILATKGCAPDNTVRFWNQHSGTQIAAILEHATASWRPSLAFHPTAPALATLGEGDCLIRIWDIETEALLGAVPQQDSVRYRAAKIVLVGDSGVGKTGLGWRLANDEFREHSSTHGQQFWLLDTLKVLREDATECEAVLWDLAGQADYRLIHGLFLDDADLALVLFNSADQLDPLRGVDFWLKSLAHRPGRPCRTILVGARCDRGDPALTQQEISAFCKSRGVSGGYVLTSAKENSGMLELTERMKAQVLWDEMTATTTTKTFKRIKEYVLALKEDSAGHGILRDWTGLREHLSALDTSWQFTDDEMKTAVSHLAKHGYVRVLRTSSGEQRILLTPDLLNNLAASFILEARRNPKGLGSLDERFIRSNSYGFKETQTIGPQERDILHDAATALFIQHNVAFRESHGTTSYLIFPELINKKKPVLDETPMCDGVSYTVSGAVENVYAALVVLLGYTNIFTRTDQWQNQAQYEVGDGEVCGFRQIAEREGELDLVLYYGSGTGVSNRAAFQALFESFLSRRLVTVTRFAPLTCPNPECGYRQERAEVVKRTLQGRGFICCSECGRKIAIPKKGEPLERSREDRVLIEHELRTAAMRTRFETALAQMLSHMNSLNPQAQAPTCFVSYAWGVPEHESWVEKHLAKDLRQAGISVHLDRWHNAAIGSDVPRFISLIAESDAVVVVGTPLYIQKYENKLASTGSVVAAEVDIINQRLMATENRKKTVLPILLQGTKDTSLPPLLRGKVHASFEREEEYFANLFDLVLSLYKVTFDDPAVNDLRSRLRSGERQVAFGD